eukprot:2836913-Rhodomonas_salina.6
MARYEISLPDRNRMPCSTQDVLILPELELETTTYDRILSPQADTAKWQLVHSTSIEPETWLLPASRAAIIRG